MKKISHISLFVLLIALFLISCSHEQVCKDITTKEAYELLTSALTDKPVLIDVRTEKERNEMYIADSVAMDIYGDNFFDEIKKMDTDKIYILYCRKGGRGKLAARIMKELGFSTVYNIEGGITKYKEDGFDIVKPEGQETVKQEEKK